MASVYKSTSEKIISNEDFFLVSTIQTHRRGAASTVMVLVTYKPIAQAHDEQQRHAGSVVLRDTSQIERSRQNCIVIINIRKFMNFML